MSVRSDLLESSLVSAHLYIKRGEYAQARDLLERVHLDFPTCVEAQQMLEMIVREQVAEACQRDINQQNAEGGDAEPPFDGFLAGLVGLAMTSVGVVILVTFIRDYQVRGHGSLIDWPVRRFSNDLVPTPIVNLLGPDFLLIIAGLALLSVAYKSWQKRHG
jgi:hypothetical protein